MEFRVFEGRMPEDIASYLPELPLDAFHRQEVLSTIYDGSWRSVLITKGSSAWFHVLAPNRIPGTRFCDIEPFLGYSGPVTNDDGPDFLGRAWTAYIDYCRGEGIVAELFRFHPLIGNQEHVPVIKNLSTIAAKEIVIIDCQGGDEAILSEFEPKSARYMVRKAKRTMTFQELSKHSDMDLFKGFYRRAMDRVEAESIWRFDDRFFQLISTSVGFRLFGVFESDLPATLSLMIDSGPHNYYFLSANSADRHDGANELLLFEMARITASQGKRYLILGGGNSASDEDPLLRFKKKFSTRTYTFFIGKAIYDIDAYEELCADASAKNALVRESRMLMKYRHA
jgi:hypothetical protein